MSSAKKKSRNELLEVIHQQQQENDALRQRVEVLKAGDVGKLKREVKELKTWKNRTEKQILELQTAAAMAQGLVLFTATGVLALLGEKIVDRLQTVPAFIEEQKRVEIQETFGDFAAELVNAVTEIDGMSKEAWERQRQIIEVRVSTLPPLKRALFDALDQLAQPSKLGTKLKTVLLQSLEFEQRLDAEQLEVFEVLTRVLDTTSNLWPLTAVNSLVPLLRHVGFDEAAEAAGEILDSLERAGEIPAKLIHRVRYDLVEMGVVEKNTKPSTIITYLTDGYQLNEYGFSPDQAAARGLVPGSPSHLKRANKTYTGLVELYERTVEFPNTEYLGQLDELSRLMYEAANRVNSQQLVEATVTEAP